ncbi:MAG: hypothetical protein E7400_02495 [Ruminococcaceae bacterium]|nr:hypothetical protein [Oscillospiraceae bacterium]
MDWKGATVVSNFQIRIISGAACAVLVLLLIFTPYYVFHIAVAAAGLVALYELYRTFDQTKKWQLMVLGYVFGVLFLMIPVLPGTISTEMMLFLLVVYLMLLSICSVVFHETIKFSDVSRAFFSLVYGVLFIMHLSYIRMMDNGRLLVVLAFLGAWLPDTFAYFAGRFFGKHKLIPQVSPKKTIEGSVGAVLGAVITFAVYGLILQFGFDYRVNYLWLSLLSLACGVVSQFGDLSASVIKRECGKKDFGNLIPGHGGMLDRIDSLVFIAPLVYYFLLIFEVISK